MTAIRELQANFGDTAAQGTIAYAQTMLDLHPELDGDVLVNDAVTAVTQFVRRLQGSQRQTEASSREPAADRVVRQAEPHCCRPGGEQVGWEQARVVDVEVADDSRDRCK